MILLRQEGDDSRAATSSGMFDFEEDEEEEVQEVNEEGVEGGQKAVNETEKVQEVH